MSGTRVEFTPPAVDAARSPVARYTRSLIVWAVCWAVAYSFGSTAGRGACLGEGSRDAWSGGGDVPVSGLVPMCTTVNMKPSVLVFVALGAILVVAIARSRRARDDLAAVRILRRAALILTLTAAASIVIALLWFFLLPIGDSAGDATRFWLPFPFASVTVEYSSPNG